MKISKSKINNTDNFFWGSSVRPTKTLKNHYTIIIQTRRRNMSTLCQKYWNHHLNKKVIVIIHSAMIFFFAVLSLQRGANVLLFSRKADDPSFHFLIFVCSFLCFGGLTFNPKLLKNYILCGCVYSSDFIHISRFFRSKPKTYVIMDHWSFAYLRDIWSISDDGISSFGCLRKEIHAR